MEPWLEDLEDDWADAGNPSPKITPAPEADINIHELGGAKQRPAFKSLIPRPSQQKKKCAEHRYEQSVQSPESDIHQTSTVKLNTDRPKQKFVSATDESSAITLQGTTRRSTISNASSLPSPKPEKVISSQHSAENEAQGEVEVTNDPLSSPLDVRSDGETADEVEIFGFTPLISKIRVYQIPETPSSTQRTSSNDEASIPSPGIDSQNISPASRHEFLSPSQAHFRSSPPSLLAKHRNRYMPASEGSPPKEAKLYTTRDNYGYSHTISTSAFYETSMCTNHLNLGAAQTEALQSTSGVLAKPVPSSSLISEHSLHHAIVRQPLHSLGSRIKCHLNNGLDSQADSIEGHSFESSTVNASPGRSKYTNNKKQNSNHEILDDHISEFQDPRIPKSISRNNLTSKRTLNGSFAHCNSSPKAEIPHAAFIFRSFHPSSPVKESCSKRQKRSAHKENDGITDRDLKHGYSNEITFRHSRSSIQGDRGYLEEGNSDLIESASNLRLDPEIDFSQSPYPLFESPRHRPALDQSSSSPVINRLNSVRVILASNVKHLIPKRLGDMVFDEVTNTWKHHGAQNAPVGASDGFVKGFASLKLEDDPFHSISDLTESRNSCITKERHILGGNSSSKIIIEPEHRSTIIEGEEGEFWGRTRVEYDLEKDESSLALDTSAFKLPSTLQHSDLGRSPRLESQPDSHVNSYFYSTHSQSPSDVAVLNVGSDGESLSNAVRDPTEAKIAATGTVSDALALSSSSSPQVGMNDVSVVSGVEDIALKPVESSHLEVWPRNHHKPSSIHDTPSQNFYRDLTSLESTAKQGGRGLVKVQKSEFSLFHTPLTEISYHFLSSDSRTYSEYSRSYVSRKPGQAWRRKLRKESSAIGTMVKNLADHDEFGPYWDSNRTFVFKARGLKDISQLAFFHPKLVEVNIEDNNLTHLLGMPHVVRDLKVAGNQLSNLTAWNHLQNLQYLDISRNKLESLTGLSSLVHLRDLKADENQIHCLDGVLHLDGLVNLRLRHNTINTLDLTRSQLKRLKSLDLMGNNISSITCLHSLPDLTYLNLDSNSIDILTIPPGQIVRNLRFLNISNNNLKRFDVSPFPSLKTLYLDTNQLEEVNGIPGAQLLDSFSMRSQSSTGYLNVPFEALHEARKIYISSNTLSSLQIETSFLNLHYLELASCGLRSLPSAFGRLMSNLRVLNLNNNAISDVKPLCGILRLRKLFLVGNRISNLQKMSKLLRFHPLLSELDLRHNPLTLGFYGVIPTNMELTLQVLEVIDPSPFILALQSKSDDERYQASMTEDALIARRCYEILISEQCPQMSYLDGLSFDRQQLLRRDWIWERMTTLGLLLDSVPDVVPVPERIEQ